jgi:hypothetical protein
MSLAGGSAGGCLREKCFSFIRLWRITRLSYQYPEPSVPACPRNQLAGSHASSLVLQGIHSACPRNQLAGVHSVHSVHSACPRNQLAGVHRVHYVHFLALSPSTPHAVLAWPSLTGGVPCGTPNGPFLLENYPIKFTVLLLWPRKSQ